MSLRNKNNSLSTISNKGKSLGNLRGKSTSVAKPSGRGLSALQKASARNIIHGKGKVGFVIDATGSREHNWEEAQSIQRKMFESVTDMGQMNLRLIHYGGGEVTDRDWQTDTNKVAAMMAEVSCRGGHTQIVESLEKFLQENSKDMLPDSIIVVGDSFEEDSNDLIAAAKKLRAKNIKVFTFQEGGCSHTTDNFKALAEITGGTYAKFGADMPLQDLCEGVALMAMGGQSALQRLKNAKARNLLLGSGPK